MKIFITAIVLAFTLTLFGVANSMAEVYTWTDENGVKHFSDRQPAEARGAKPAFQAYEYDEAADRQRTQSDAKAVQKAVKDINQEYAAAEQEKQRQEEEAEENRPPTMEERVEDERTKLKLKIAELESLPLDHFGSQQNKIRSIGYYKYRLADLEKDPEKYFRLPPPRFEGNVKDPVADEKK
jgi:flagellar biosynthesis GTPase FlhF